MTMLCLAYGYTVQHITPEMVVLIFKKRCVYLGQHYTIFCTATVKNIGLIMRIIIDTTAIINADKSVRMYAMKGC